MELDDGGTYVNIMRFVGFIGPSYVLSSVNVDCQRCVNLYPEIDELGTGKESEVASLVSTPGLTLLVTLPTSPVRGLWKASNGAVYAVAGNKVYSISSSWVATPLTGTLATASGPVSMDDNGIQLVIVDGTNGFYVTLATNVLTQITDLNFLGANTVSFQDGYFIFNKPNSNIFYVSNLYDVTFNALAIGTADGRPDYLVGQISANQNLYLLGSQSLEVYYDAGDTPMPFSRIQGAVLAVGCSAAASIARIQTSVYWVGGDETGSGIVYRMQGYTPQRISTPAVESALRSVSATNLAAARAWCYQQGGHVFYCLNVTGLSTTWVYDQTTSLWHERTYLDKWGFLRHQVDCATVAFGQNIGGDYQTGNIYLLDSSNYTDNGNSIVRMRTTPHLSKDMRRLYHGLFQLDLETGVGLSGTGQGTDPMAMLQWSDDGGHTWSNEHWATIGKVGNTKHRAIWRRLGRSRDRVYRVMISDPVKVALIGAELGLEEATA